MATNRTVPPEMLVAAKKWEELPSAPPSCVYAEQYPHVDECGACLSCC